MAESEASAGGRRRRAQSRVPTAAASWPPCGQTYARRSTRRSRTNHNMDTSAPAIMRKNTRALGRRTGRGRSRGRARMLETPGPRREIARQRARPARAKPSCCVRRRWWLEDSVRTSVAKGGVRALALVEQQGDRDCGKNPDGRDDQPRKGKAVWLIVAPEANQSTPGQGESHGPQDGQQDPREREDEPGDAQAWCGPYSVRLPSRRRGCVPGESRAVRSRCLIHPLAQAVGGPGEVCLTVIREDVGGDGPWPSRMNRLSS